MTKPSWVDRAMARVCVGCLVCRRARQRQRGMAFRLVQRLEAKLCPFCLAYDRVYGRKAHEAAPGAEPPPESSE
ncbi:MAG TPA: hypothetical protein P5555_18075 [Candidatus Paceibacterota bacterium]|nr:hypothetical protein [Verrucomicrobiota bacterium]HRZ47090.1 hypothetical protein [Candidatus Paceibacterota bacterium]HRZ93590.1 hypothetical protein [Candidatus Paceibacterota bacterium]